jgi:protein ImuB
MFSVPRYLCVFLPSLPPARELHEAVRIEALADWCRRFTPLAATDGPDGLVLDVAGAAHLFGGEAALLALIERKLARHCARAAIADTPEAGWAMARFGPELARERILASGDSKALMRAVSNLPVAALRIDSAIALALSQTGLKRIGDIALRPRAPIAARFGASVFARLDAMLGQSKSPICPRFEAPAYVAERRYMDGVCAREHIEATILALAHDVCDMLVKHDEGARSIAAVLFRVDGAGRRIDCATSRPQRDPALIARLFREKLDSIEADNNSLDVGYGFDLIRLAVMHAEPLGARQDKIAGIEASKDLVTQAQNEGAGFARTGQAQDALADFLDRMSARFGAQRVLRLSPQDTHMPERAMILTPAARGLIQPEPPAPVDERPLRLFERPERIDAIAQAPDGPPLKFRWRRVIHDVVAYEGPERIAPEWWRSAAPSLTRDYFRVEDKNGRRFWLYREGIYVSETQAPRWFVQGLFA